MRIQPRDAQPTPHRTVAARLFGEDEPVTTIDVALFVVGWSFGWVLLWRIRPLPAACPSVCRAVCQADREHTGVARSAIAVVVPARDEAHAIGDLAAAISPRLRPGDEFVVVDDHSTDDTASIAAHLGARVIAAPDLPAGWLGKPHACWHGALATTAPTLLFLDADVRPAADLLDRIGPIVDAHPDRVVSLQPWHRTEGWQEQASLLCNVTALMGAGAFTVAGERVRPQVAFGPVLAVPRDTYLRIDGHRGVRTMHTEDIGLARAAGGALLFTGRPDTTFRMYPGGLVDVIRGWTRSVATGARFARWWIVLATACWIAALAGGWLASGFPPQAPIESLAAYMLCVVQVWVLGRRAGSMRPLTALLYPIAVAVFVVVFARSTVAVVLRREVTWKGRRVEARSS
jgi:4,4'-diaponeurosporenoate glycosyltransferase